MDACKGCGKDQDRIGTHWEGCHEHHPECAAYKAGHAKGFEKGAKWAADIVNYYYVIAKPQCEANYTDGDVWLQTAHNAILSEMESERKNN